MTRLRLPAAALLVSLLAAAPARADDAAPAREATAATAGGVEIVRVWTSYRDARSFVRLSEYFDGRENTGSTLVLRSQPEHRDGFYFTVRLASRDRAPLPQGRIVLHVVAPDAEKPRTYAFPLDAGGARSRRLEVGLTGTDWTYGGTLPLAWQIEVIGADGTLLAGRESFLWSKKTAASRDSGS